MPRPRRYCDLDDCERIRYGGVLCRLHYNRQRSAAGRVEKACGVCGTGFLADRRRSLYCSRSCSAEAKRLDDLTRPVDRVKRAESQRTYIENNPAKNWAKAAAYRARKAAAFVEDVDRDVVFERDGWRCGICSDPIDGELRHPHPMSASVDHRVPLVAGGEHSYANCQAAHLGCNVKKGGVAA